MALRNDIFKMTQEHDALNGNRNCHSIKHTYESWYSYYHLYKREIDDFREGQFPIKTGAHTIQPAWRKTEG